MWQARRFSGQTDQRNSFNREEGGVGAKNMWFSEVLNNLDLLTFFGKVVER